MNTNDSTNAQSQGNSAAAKPLGMLAHQLEIPKDNSPAWNFVNILKSPPVGPDDAKAIIEARPVPGNLHKPSTIPAIKAAIATGTAGNTVGGPASIAELARALRNDVDLIYEWVFNNIETLPNYGLHKGALGALLDGFGTAFDQSDLLVKLLRQAGYTANYVTGTLSMDAATLGAWLGTDTTNVYASYNMLIGSGTPVALVFPNLEFSHCWVECTIGGTIYTFDPARKTYTTKSKIDLATAMGYNQATFLSRANTGATITADYVQNMNRANIRADLDTFSNNLVSWIKTNNHGAALDDILGGRNIVQNDAAVPTRQIGNPFLKSGSTPTVWTALPQSLKATMAVTFSTISQTFNTEDLAGKRLTLFWNGSHQAELRLDGTLLATSAVLGVGVATPLILNIVHPYAVTWYNQSAYHYIVTDKPHLICNSFGSAGRGASQFHSRRMKANLAAGMATTDESVFGELLAATWKMWDAAQNKVTDIANRLTNCTTMYHHQCGVMGWYDTPLTNLGAVTAATAALDNNYNQQQYNDTVIAMHGVALEAQIFNQFANMDGVSATPLVDIASSAGQKIYDAKSANWLSTVKPALVNYSPSTLNDIEFGVLTLGERAGVPENGLITRGSWVGYGYYRIPTFGTFGIIGGALKGGGGSQPNSIDDWSSFGSWAPDGSGGYDKNLPAPASGNGGNGGGMMPGNSSPGASNQNPMVSPEPIDMAYGDYLMSVTDMTVGSSGYPYGLGFERSYNSASRLQDSPLGWGWKHNYQISALQATDALMGLGSHSVIGSAAAIAEIFVAIDVHTDLTKPFSKYVTSAIASQWFIDNLTNNAVMISSGHKELMFIKLRDGTYAPPRNNESTVIKNVDGTFTYKTQQKNTTNFNLRGQIVSQVEPFGVTLTYTYTAGKLTSVTNGLSRTLTFTYLGNRLQSVSDGTRTVTFIVDGNGNLTSKTDPNLKNWVYEYDLPGRMTKFFGPANPTIALATNTYDSLDRVKEQRDYQSNLWQYFFAGSRSQEMNPNGKSAVCYFNSIGRAVKSINRVGKISREEFDGRGNVIKSIAPEGNFKETTYNVSGLPTQVKISPKPGSGLIPIVIATVTYDPVWFKVKTFTDALGRTTTYNYDLATGNLLSVVAPVVAGVGTPQTTMTYNSRGQLLTVTDPTGIVSVNTYDVSTEKLLSAVLDSGVGRLNLSVSFTHNSVGDLISVQDQRGNVTGIAYDVLRRTTQVTSPAPFSFVTKLTYDDNGNRIKVEKQTSDPVNPWQTSEASFTPDNKVLTITDLLGNQVLNQYDNIQRLWKTTDQAGRLLTRTYDDADRLSFVTDPAGLVIQTQTYTDNGQISTVSDVRGQITTMTWDGFDRADKAIYPDLTFEQSSNYDLTGNAQLLTTRSGATVSVAFDELGRVKTKSPSGQAVVTTTYDLAGRVITVSTPVIAGDPSSGTFTRFYDTAGRFFKEQYPDGLSTTSTLDASGNVTKITYPDGFFVDRVFDELNRLTDIKLNGAGTSAVQISYDALNRRTKLTYENGCTTNYSFAVNNDLSELLQNFVGSNVGHKYSFDAVGQMQSLKCTDPANYRWTPSAPNTVSYGLANNLNEYPTVGGVSHTYSNDGNLTNDGTFKYEFNSERSMTRVRNAGTNAIISEYLYDPFMRQRQKSVSGVKTNFYYAGWQRIADYDGTANTLQQRYVYSTNDDEMLIQISAAGTKTYFHHNNQGSVTSITNSSGSVVNRYKYSPFGESPNLAGTTFGFTGHRFDAETGLYYCKRRYYSPRLGRFLQPDPYSYSQGFNLYAYCFNSPLSYTDSSGLAANDTSIDSYHGSLGFAVDPTQTYYSQSNPLRLTVATHYWATATGVASLFINNPAFSVNTFTKNNIISNALKDALISTTLSLAFAMFLSNKGLIQVPFDNRGQGLLAEELAAEFLTLYMRVLDSQVYVESTGKLNPNAPANTVADFLLQDPIYGYTLGEVKSSRDQMPSLSNLSLGQALTLGVTQFGGQSTLTNGDYAGLVFQPNYLFLGVHFTPYFPVAVNEPGHVAG